MHAYPQLLQRAERLGVEFALRNKDLVVHRTVPVTGHAVLRHTTAVTITTQSVIVVSYNSI